jgi:hypothetical protein
LKLLDDFANRVHDEIGRFRLQFTLSPDQLNSKFDESAQLIWKCIKYGDDVPSDRIPELQKKGIYAFVIQSPTTGLPPHGYVLYIGIAGRRSNRSLKKRYEDYFNETKLIKERPRIAQMIGSFREALYFYYATVPDLYDSKALENLEKQLTGVLLPPYSKQDIEANIKESVKAFP